MRFDSVKSPWGKQLFVGALMMGVVVLGQSQGSGQYALFDRESWKLEAEQDYDAAFARSLEALEARVFADEPIIDVAYQLGYCSVMMGSPIEGQYWYGMAYNDVKALGKPATDAEREFLSALLNNLGVTEMRLQEDATAVSFFDEARALAEEMGDDRGVRETLLNQATVLTHMGRFEDAEALYEQVRNMFEALDDPMSLAFVDFNMGRLYEQEGNWEKSLAHFAATEEGLLALGDTGRASISVFEQVKVLNRWGQAERLNAAASRFIEQYPHDGSPRDAFAVALSEAAVAIHSKRPGEAAEWMQEASRIWSENAAAFQTFEHWKVDLLYTQSIFAALEGDFTAIEQVVFSMEDETRQSLESTSQLRAQEREEVSRWIEYMANLRGAKNRQTDQRAIALRNGLIVFVALLSLVIGIIGYREHRKGQRFLIGIISRRARKDKDEEFDAQQAGKPAGVLTFNDLFEEIERVMKVDRPFLDANLSVGGLAQLVNANYTYTSRAVQGATGLGVADYINRYRVDHVMEVMLDPNCAHYSLEHISELSGFNSVSTLYRQFKRFAGVTPGVFRKTLEEGGSNG